MIYRIRVWLLKVFGKTSPSGMYIIRNDFYGILTTRELCVLQSAMYQSIKKYKDLYNKPQSIHYMNQRTERNIEDMQTIHDITVKTLKRIGVKPEEVE